MPSKRYLALLTGAVKGTHVRSGKRADENLLGFVILQWVHFEVIYMIFLPVSLPRRKCEVEMRSRPFKRWPFYHSGQALPSRLPQRSARVPRSCSPWLTLTSLMVTKRFFCCGCRKFERMWFAFCKFPMTPTNAQGDHGTSTKALMSK